MDSSDGRVRATPTLERRLSVLASVAAREAALRGSFILRATDKQVPAGQPHLEVRWQGEGPVGFHQRALSHRP
jgi:hypothetical protein